MNSIETIPGLRERLQEYIDANPVARVKGLISAFTKGASYHSLAGRTMTEGAIHWNENTLVVGSRLYSFYLLTGSLESTEIEQLPALLPTCASCSASLTSEFFSDPQGKFNVYYCATCRPSSRNPSQCGICLVYSDEEGDSPSSIITPCGHCFCKDCLTGLQSMRTTRCPTCSGSLGFEFKQKTFTIDEVMERFQAEWDKSPEATVAARAHHETHLPLRFR